MPRQTGPKPRVTCDGQTYTARSYKTEVPDLEGMDRTAALVWLLRHTTPTGYSRPRPTLPPVRLIVQ